MMQKEYEALMGTKVTAEEYLRVERVYENAGDMSKQEFCADYKKHHGSAIIAALDERVTVIEGRAAGLKKELDDARKELEEACRQRDEARKGLADMEQELGRVKLFSDGTDKILDERTRQWEDEKKKREDLEVRLFRLRDAFATYIKEMGRNY